MATLREDLETLAASWRNTGSLLDEAGRELTSLLAAHPVEPTALKPLVCPYCGDEFNADLRYTGYAYSEHRDLHGYECGNYQCNAEWDKHGVPTKPSDKAVQS